MSDPWASIQAEPGRALQLDQGAVRAIDPTDEELGRGRRAAFVEGFSQSIGGRAIQFGRQQLGEALDILRPVDPFHPGPLTKDQAVEQAKAAGVDVSAGIGSGGISPRALAEIIRDKQEQQERQRAIAESRISGVDQVVAGLAGGLADPVNLLPVGGAFNLAKGATLAGTAARTLAVGAATAVPFTAAHGALVEATGTEYTLDDAMHEFAWSAGATAGLLGLGHAVGWTLGRRADMIAKQAALLEEADSSFAFPEKTAALDKLQEIQDLKPGDLPDEEFAELARNIADAHPDLVANARADMVIEELRATIAADKAAQAAERRPSAADMEKLREYAGMPPAEREVAAPEMQALRTEIARTPKAPEDPHAALLEQANEDIRAAKEAAAAEGLPDPTARADDVEVPNYQKTLRAALECAIKNGVDI